MQGLKNKVAVCTGAGRRDGLGAEILRRLAQEGCRIVVTDLGKPDDLLDSGNPRIRHNVFWFKLWSIHYSRGTEPKLKSSPRW